MSEVILMIPVDREKLTPEEYLKLNDIDLSNIESTTLIPPKLGSVDFGKIQVTYRSPIFKATCK